MGCSDQKQTRTALTTVGTLALTAASMAWKPESSAGWSFSAKPLSAKNAPVASASSIMTMVMVRSPPTNVPLSGLW